MIGCLEQNALKSPEIRFCCNFFARITFEALFSVDIVLNIVNGFSARNIFDVFVIFSPVYFFVIITCFFSIAVGYSCSAQIIS